MNIELSPSNDFLLTFPSGRKLAVPNNEYATEFLERILRNERNGLRDQPGCIGVYPTEHVVLSWLREKRKRVAKEQEESFHEKLEAMDIDPNSIEISL